METNGQMKFKIRAGTIDSGKKYEYKIAALICLRCVLLEEEMWILSNADGIGAFDDIVLRQGNQTFMLQLKHKDQPNPLDQKDYLSRKGDFFLRKYYQDIIQLKEALEFKGSHPAVINYLGSFETIRFLLFTNRTTNEYEFLEESSDIPSFLNTSKYKNTELKINASKLPDIPNADRVGTNIYLLSNQIHAKDVDLKIAKMVGKIAKHFQIEHLNVKQIGGIFTKYVEDWINGILGGHYCLTKFDIIGKLTELFYWQQEIPLNRAKFTFYSCAKKQIWNSIIQDKTLTIVDYDENILKFLFEYLGHEINKYCNVCAWNDVSSTEAQNTWNDVFSTEAQNTFYKSHSLLKSNMLKIVGNHGKIAIVDVYRCLWMNRQLPLLLEVDDIQQYDNILRILKFSNYDYKIIVINKCKTILRSPENEQTLKSFTTVKDLNETNTAQMLSQEIKLQGRSSIKLEKLINNDMLHYIECKDVINVLLGNFNIGNILNPLPEYFISRSISKIFLLAKVLSEVHGEIFLIESTCQNNLTNISEKYSSVYQLQNIDVNKLRRGGIVINSRITTYEEIEMLKSLKIPVHRLSVYNDGYLEWKTSFGSIQNLRPFKTDLGDVTEIPIPSEWDSRINIISAVPGMGKSVLMDFVALQPACNKWVLRINLNGHKSHYETAACKNSDTKAIKHLEYFKTSVLTLNNGSTQLSDAVFEKLSKTKDIIVLLDGFDEISLLYKTEVTNIAKSLYKEGYCVCLTTRPHMSSHLENEFDTFSLSLKSFSLTDQKDFLTNYFCAEQTDLNDNSKKLVISFVENLLEASKMNLNDWAAEFTGIPLQTKLLADAFKDKCSEYVSTEGHCDFNDNFDLVSLYQTFIDNKIAILCKKFGDDAKTTRSTIIDHQLCFAIKLIFSQHENLILYQSVMEKLICYYKDNPKQMELLQREGVAIVDRDFNVNFVHRTYGEYLAALWLAENLKGSGDRRGLARILVKERFTQDYKFLFGLFDRILSKGSLLHLAIINNKTEEISQLLNSNPDILREIDLGGRSVLHIIALYGLQLPPLFDKFAHPYVISYKAFKFLQSKKIDKDEIINTLENVLTCNIPEFKNVDLLGYNALDYALANQSLKVAHHIIETFPSLTVNATIGLPLKRNYLVYCVFQKYVTLFKVLLPYFAAKDLLLDNVDKNVSIISYVKMILRISNYPNPSVVDKNYIEQVFQKFEADCEMLYKNITILQLLQPTSEIKWKINITNYSDVRYAICFGSESTVNRLLKNEATINQQDTECNTPLHYAVLHRKPAIVNMILWKYSIADPNKQNLNKNTPLHLAFASMNNEDSLSSFITNNKRNRIVKTLLAVRADINIKNDDGVTPLHLAVENGKYDWVKLFISNTADVNVQDGNGSSALHLAAVADYNNILSILLNNGKNIKVNIQNNEGETPLFHTVRNNNIAAIKLLRDKGADVSIPNTYGETVLHLLATHGHNEALHAILNENTSVNINVIDNYGWTPFSYALFNNNIETVKILLDSGVNLDILGEKGKLLLQFAITSGHKNTLSAVLVNGSNIDINMQDKDGRTTLFNAVKNKDINKVTQLLRLEAKVDVPDKQGLTVLHLFAGVDGIEFSDVIIKILNKNFTKIDGNIRDNNGRTPLFHALQSNKKSVAKLFLSNGADVHIRDKNGVSSLHLIACRGFNDILMSILSSENSIDINMQDNNGRTALHYAVQENNINAVNVLVSNNADVNVRDKNGTSCLHIVANRGFTDVLEILLNSDHIDPNIQDMNGRTPLHCALQEGNASIVLPSLSKGADFTKQDKNGISPIHLLAGKDYNDILITVLRNAGSADLNIQDNDGQTPLFYASLNKKPNSVALLCYNGADINIQNKHGQTAFEAANDVLRST